jgi:hypothetical protein
MTYYATNTADDLDIDLSTVAAASSFEPIPAGDYQLQCVGVELVTSQAGHRMLKAQFQVLGGAYDNRRLFENFNVTHTNPKVVEIAQRQLKAWVIACGYAGNERLTMAMLHALEGREFIGTVRIEKDKTGQYGDSNRVRAYKPLPGAVQPQAGDVPPAPSAPAAPPPPPQAAPNGAQRPWERH